MKFLFRFLILILPAVADCGQSVAVTAGGKITVYRVEEKKLSESQSIDLNGLAGPMGMSPDHKLLYVNTTIPGENHTGKTPAFATFQIGADGTLTHLHTAPSGWNSGYVSADATGRFLAGNSYGVGKVGIWPLDKDGVYRGAPPLDFELEKNTHCAVFSPDNRFLFVPATGPNKIFQLVFNSETGAVYPNQPSSSPGPRGEDEARQPRHLIFHPTKDFAYTTNEQKLPGAGVWKFDRENGTLESIEGISTIDTDSDGMSTADLHFSADGRFLFVSNRDAKSRKEPQSRDAIAVFKVDDDTGKLTFVNRYPCERIPRSFAVGLGGELLFVSGQGDSKLGVYQIDQATGSLSKLATHVLPGSPVWVSVLPHRDG